MKVLKIDYSAVHDGPGIRTAIYLKGCPLRCIWCSNPEGQAPEPNLIFLQLRCIGCGLCSEKCPKRAIEFLRDNEGKIQKIKLNRGLCDLCGECILICPSKALEIWGIDHSIADILAIVEKNRPIYRKSGGGITLTGGDPLYQWESSLELLKKCRKEGIHTVAETCAYAEEGVFGRILEEIDWLFIDLKHMNPEEHQRLTGQRNDLILKNVKRASSVLGKRNRDLVIRIVIVPGITDGDNIHRAATFIRSLPYIKGVELLPYHRYAMTKYELLNRQYKIPNLEPPSDELMENCREAMASYGLVKMDTDKMLHPNGLKKQLG